MPYHSKHTIHFPIHRNESSALYWAHSIRQLGLSISGIYLPIYIYQIVNKPTLISNPIVNSIIFVVIFFIIKLFSSTITTIFASNLIFSKIKFKMSFLISLIILSIYLITWFYSKNHPLLLIITALSAGIQNPFYWIPYHIFFTRKIAAVPKNSINRAVSLRTVIMQIIGAIGPLIGGLLITHVGYQLTIGISTLILLSSFPFFLLIKEHKHYPHHFKTILKDAIKDKRYHVDLLAFGGLAIDNLLYTIFWPILLFVYAVSIESLGFLTSTAIIISMISALSIEKLAKKYGQTKIHIIGVLFNTLFYILRSFIIIPIFLIGIEITDRINAPFYTIIMQAKTYEEAKGLHSSNFIIIRQFIMQLAALISILFIFTIIMLTSSWRFVFIIAALASLTTALISINRFTHLKHVSTQK